MRAVLRSERSRGRESILARSFTRAEQGPRVEVGGDPWKAIIFLEPDRHIRLLRTACSNVSSEIIVDETPAKILHGLKQADLIHRTLCPILGIRFGENRV